MLKKIGLGVIGLGVLLCGVGFALPSKIHVERSIVVQAPQASIFDLVNGYERFNEWSPWAARDPQAKYEFAGPKTGVGAKMSWQSEKDDVGTGSQEIVESEAPRRVKTALDFGAHGTAFATFELTAADGGTKVTWGMDSDAGANIVARYFGLMMDSMIGPDYEKGLASLKQLAEAAPAPKAEQPKAAAAAADAMPAAIPAAAPAGDAAAAVPAGDAAAPAGDAAAAPAPADAAPPAGDPAAAPEPAAPAGE